MKAKLILSSCEKNEFFKDGGELNFKSEQQIFDECTVEPTRLSLHPWDVEAWLINVHPEIEFQKILGFGGAFTDTAAHALLKMPKEKQDEFFDAYFDEEKGIGYNFCRTHIASCDFSTENYSYVEEGDMTLDTFSIERDYKALIPMIKGAKAVNPELLLFASPWSPPAYMKTNNQLIDGGHLKPEFYPLYAKYIRKYIDAYKADGLDIWGMSVQNEPRHNQVWESCVYTPEMENEFLKNHLGPTLEDTDVNIICYDHCRERLYERSANMYNDPKANKYCKGSCYHWYSGDHLDQIDLVNRLWPDKYIISSEGCNADKTPGYIKPEQAKYGENYAHELCGGLKNGINAFTDWNLALDQHNGPAHNREGRLYCNAPIFCDSDKGINYLTPAYYYIGHFSKYIKRDAVRVGSSCYTTDLETVALKNPDGSTVIVILNRTDSAQPFVLRFGDLSAPKTEIPAHSIITAIVTE